MNITYVSSNPFLVEQFLDIYSPSHENNIFYYYEKNYLYLYESKNIYDIPFEKTKKFMGSKSDEILMRLLIAFNNYYEELMFLKFRDTNKFRQEVFKFMYCFANENYGDLERGMISYCSHSMGFLYRDSSYNYLQLFMSKFKKNKSNLKYLLKTRENSLFQKYNLSNIIKEYKNHINTKILSGEITFFNMDHNITKDELDSPFHKTLKANKKFLQFMKEDSEFLTSRFLTIFQYFFLRNLGIDGPNRYYYCYLIYKSIESEFNVSPENLMKNFD
ncbi:TPA: hypothetical protein PD805_002644 [Staphylococcus aureus]|nr:hypothetical protein [Staphylococcus aureus]HDE7973603.1 hypothetical protein [Staphylococcus aureus]HDE8177988.1 hypothetical protein [Staphylococcus aureus]HDE8718319.1 hypothetical protein [Staphylococcus aureus]HDE9051602.1 hypothetical protein [Staphylococcus aureus]